MKGEGLLYKQVQGCCIPGRFAAYSSLYCVNQILHGWSDTTLSSDNTVKTSDLDMLVAAWSVGSRSWSMLLRVLWSRICCASCHVIEQLRLTSQNANNHSTLCCILTARQESSTFWSNLRNTSSLELTKYYCQLLLQCSYHADFNWAATQPGVHVRQ